MVKIINMKKKKIIAKCVLSFIALCGIISLFTFTTHDQLISWLIGISIFSAIVGTIWSIITLND